MPEQFTQGPSILQSDIVNNLTTDSSTKPLSAAQGKVLKDATDTIDSNLTKSIKSVCPIAEGNTHSAFVAGMVIYIRNHPTLTEGSYTVTQYVAQNATLSDSNVTYNYYGGLDVLNTKMENYISRYDGSVAKGVNDTQQISSAMMSKKILFITCRRYGYGCTVVVPVFQIINDRVANGISLTGVATADDTVVIKISSSGLITVVSHTNSTAFYIDIEAIG